MTKQLTTKADGVPRVGTVKHGEYLVRAVYSGGPYVELSFDLDMFHRQGRAVSWPHPSEVINILDYSKSSFDPERYDRRVNERGGVRRILVEWIKTVTDPEQGGDPDAIRRYYENQ